MCFYKYIVFSWRQIVKSDILKQAHVMLNQWNIANITNQRHMFDINLWFRLMSKCLLVPFCSVLYNKMTSQKSVWPRIKNTIAQIHINIAFYEWNSFHLFIAFRIFRVQKQATATGITIVQRWNYEREKKKIRRKSGKFSIFSRKKDR